MKLEDLGKPWTIIKFNQNDESFRDHSGVLKSLFQHEKVRDRQAVVFSVIGSFRRGKSFYLDYCLRYLYSNYDSLNRINSEFKKKLEWYGNKDAELNGFSWRSGAERDTTGIIFWSDVFFHTNEFDEKFAIFLVDTQGLFDNETTLMENSKIFALSSLISSIQVINLNGNIREDELDYFQFAMEFAKLAQKDGKNPKTFQKLVFLVRDWQHEEDYKFGVDGGNQYLQDVLKLKDNKSKELNSVREFLSKSCEKLLCHLLPHPGKIVAGKKNFRGQWSLMDEDFRDELFYSIENLLRPENLVAKNICGRKMDAESLYTYLQVYFKYFASADLPKVTTIYQTIVEKDMDYLIEKYYKIYEERLTVYENKIKSEAEILDSFKSCQYDVISNFRADRKFGNAEMIKDAENKLNKKIDDHFRKWEISQKKLLNKQRAVERLNNETGLLARALSNEQSSNRWNDEKIRALTQELKVSKERFEDQKENERKKFEKSLDDMRNENQNLQEKIKEQNMKITRLVESSAVVSRPAQSYSPPSQSYQMPCFLSSGNGGGYSSSTPSRSYSSSPSVSSGSSRAVNPWNTFQTQFKSQWDGTGSFQKACSQAYRASKK